MKPVLDIKSSVLEQAWHWRGGGTDGRDPDFQPDDLVTQLLMARGVERDDIERHRNPTIRNFMPDPSIFQDMEHAAMRLAVAVEAGEQITVYGDYDVDGATSAALLIRLLRMLGLDAGYYIPDRLMEGYGPSGEALVRIGESGSRLIVTVDCGAMAYDALAQAKAAGLEVIVVDHHKCASELPQAFALVNPNRLDEADDAALVDGEGDPVDGAERAEVALEVFDEDGGSGHDRGESGDRAAEDDVIAFPADGGERVDETGAGV